MIVPDIVHRILHKPLGCALCNALSHSAHTHASDREVCHTPLHCCMAYVIGCLANVWSIPADNVKLQRKRCNATSHDLPLHLRDESNVQSSRFAAVLCSVVQHSSGVQPQRVNGIV